MTIQDEIEKQLNDNIVLVSKIESLMAKDDFSDEDKRDILLAGFTRNVISHFLSISYLIDKKLYNSAFALVRIFFENILKLKYMYLIMDDEKIKTIYSAKSWDNHFPRVGEMAKALDGESDISFYTKIKQKAYKMMNDYTHTGPNQIARNFSELDLSVDSNFSDELILETLKSNYILLKTAVILFLAGVGYKNGFISEEELDAFLDY